MGPELVQHPLARADGSTVLTDELFAVIAGVNGPIEVQRRDELSEEAAIEVNLRPSSGVGGPRERWLETVLQALLKSLLLVHMHPRTLIQITLQITKEPASNLQRANSDIAIISTLVNAAFMALIDGGLPLATTMSAVLAAVSHGGQIKVNPKEEDIAKCASIHAMAFTTDGEQLLGQSSGEFSMDVWEQVASAARQACAAAIAPIGEEAAMATGDGHSLDEPWLRQTLHDRAMTVNRWQYAP